TDRGVTRTSVDAIRGSTHRPPPVDPGSARWEDHAAAGAGREPVEGDGQILRGQAPDLPGQHPHRLLEELDGAPFARAAVGDLVPPGALGDQGVRVLLPAPAAEPLGSEGLRLLPQRGIVAGAVE